MSSKYFDDFTKSKDYSNEVLPYEDHDATKKEDYRIAICQDGKFVVTFDVGK